MIRVALAHLVPGDVVQDLIAAGTVADVTPMGRAGAMHVRFTDGTCLHGPDTFTVATTRELAEVDQ